MFYETMMDYIYTYLIAPLYTWLRTEFGISTNFGIIDGQVYFSSGNSVVHVGEYEYNLIEMPYLITQIVGLIIMALLIILMVKFILWLFKQISFITRF